MLAQLHRQPQKLARQLKIAACVDPKFQTDALPSGRLPCPRFINGSWYPEEVSESEPKVCYGAIAESANQAAGHDLLRQRKSAVKSA